MLKSPMIIRRVGTRFACVFAVAIVLVIVETDAKGAAYMFRIDI